MENGVSLGPINGTEVLMLGHRGDPTFELKRRPAHAFLRRIKSRVMQGFDLLDSPRPTNEGIYTGFHRVSDYDMRGILLLLM